MLAKPGGLAPTDAVVRDGPSKPRSLEKHTQRTLAVLSNAVCLAYSLVSCIELEEPLLSKMLNYNSAEELRTVKWFLLVSGETCQRYHAMGWCTPGYNT